MVKKRPAVKKAVRSKTKSKKTKSVKARKRIVKKVIKPKKKLKVKAKKKVIKSKAKPKKVIKKVSPKAKPKKLKLVKKAGSKKTAAKKPFTKNIKSKTLGTKTKMRPTAETRKTVDLKALKAPKKSSKNYMTPKNAAEFRAALLKWKQDLMAGVDKTIHHMQDEAANFADPNDRATQEEEFSLELRTRDRERKLMTKIDEALERIDNGEYGFCEECGIEIGLERLRARPTATLCIDCKTLDEIREKQVAN